MKRLFSRYLSLLLLALFVAACSKNEKKADPQPKNGTVNGQITPANSITTVTAVSVSTQATTTATPTATGAYTFSLPAGDYTLRFTPALGYTAPAEQLISVSAGGITVPGKTNVTQSGGSAALTLNGTPLTVSLVRAELAFGDLNLTILTTTGQSAVLTISPYTSGTSQSGNFAGFSHARVWYREGQAEWASPANGSPVGTYTVLPVSANPSRVSGTFSVPLNPSSASASGTKTISGSFADVAY